MRPIGLLAALVVLGMAAGGSVQHTPLTPGPLSATPAPSSASTLSVSIDCYERGSTYYSCYSDVSGGTGIYTSYVWTPGNKTGWNAVFRTTSCSSTVSLTVTDSNGATGYATDPWGQCVAP